MSIWIGASCFIHADWLRYDKVIRTIFGWKSVPSQSTYSRFFHKFSWKRNTEVFVQLQRWFFDQLGSDKLTLDLDSTVITRYGNQESSRRGYNPVKPGRFSHHPCQRHGCAINGFFFQASYGCQCLVTSG